MPRMVPHKIIGQINTVDIIELPPITQRIVEIQGWQIGTKAEEIGITIIITIKIIRDKITPEIFKIIVTLISEEIIEVGIIISRIEQIITIRMAITIPMAITIRIILTIQMDIIIIGMAIIKIKIEAATITITGRETIGEIIIMVSITSIITMTNKMTLHNKTLLITKI